jgi:hypothetical protein
VSTEQSRSLFARNDRDFVSSLRSLFSFAFCGDRKRQEGSEEVAGTAPSLRWAGFYSTLGRRKKALREGGFWLGLFILGVVWFHQAPKEAETGWRFYALETDPELRLLRGDKLRFFMPSEILEDVLVLDARVPGTTWVVLRAEEIPLVQSAKQEGVLKIQLQRIPPPVKKKTRRARAARGVQIWEGK